MHSLLFSVIATTLSLVSAVNDWSLPCLDGECSYDLPPSVSSRTKTTVSGSMRIWGNTSALSDITTAAGWTILECNSTSLAQEIRLVCTNEDGDGCNNLFAGATGGVNKLVRLPESCGKMAFARVAKIWTHENQQVPQDVARSRSSPIVHGLAIDTNFAAIDPQTVGTLNIAIQGSNVPTVPSNTTTTTSSTSAADRSLLDVVDDALGKFNQININETKTLDHISFQKNLPVIDEKISCPLPGGGNFDAGFDISVNGCFWGDVTLGIVATGTVVPPQLDNFNVFAGLSAFFGGTLDLKANAGASISSPEITLFQLGLPGLSFPGILNVGPSFSVKAQAKAAIEADVDLKNFQPNRRNLTLSVSPDAGASGTLEFHLIPRGFLDLDSSATVTATLDAKGPTISKNLGNSSEPAQITDADFLDV
ncbi:hypothetical protein BT69DRAFT_1350058 [Atractiella rhizophila]|nr:hypothetical protein BT69DRAFT_1350058 [Atractiella rhizophila]